MLRNLQVVILCGGLGTRLGELTKDIPKPMIPVKGKPFLEHQITMLIKQGFTNYQYQIADAKGNIDAENAIDGNFWQTENDYSILVYYRESSDRYDRVIGKATANSNVITN